MEETTQRDDRAYAATAKSQLVAAKPSVLDQLLGEQSRTAELLGILEQKIQPISDPSPRDGSDKPGGFHVATALYNQRDINTTIEYLLNTIVV